MDVVQIEILNPKARKLIADLADLNLISIRAPKKNDIESVVKKIRSKALKNPVSLEEITKEVEMVRARRYEKAKR